MFEDSNLPLRTWFHAIYLVFISKKGINAVANLARELGVTQENGVVYVATHSP